MAILEEIKRDIERAGWPLPGPGPDGSVARRVLVSLAVFDRIVAAHAPTKAVFLYVHGYPICYEPSMPDGFRLSALPDPT